MLTLLQGEEVEEAIRRAFQTIEFKVEGSTESWSFGRSSSVSCSSSSFTPTGRSYVEIPYKTKGIINIQNEDDKCFMWAVLAALHPAAKDPQRVSKYKAYKDELDFEGIEMPFNVKDAKKFEKQNNKAIYIYALGDSVGEVSPLHLSIFHMEVCQGEMESIDIGLYEGHYVWTKNISALLSKSKGKNKTYLCRKCLHPFTSKEALDRHIPSCLHVGRIIMPDEKNRFISFKKHERRLISPVAIYGDFDCIIEPPNELGQCMHRASGYCFRVVSRIPQVTSKTYLYRGTSEDDVMKKFYNRIFKLNKEICAAVKNTEVEMEFTQEDETHFNEATHCHICKKELNGDSVRDHDHFTGKYRGAAHTNCNINYNFKYYKIPVFFHNLK
jgi:hypothetical protein